MVLTPEDIIQINGLIAAWIEDNPKDVNVANNQGQIDNNQIEQDQHIADLAVAQAWFDATILPTLTKPPTTREEALTNHSTILAALTSETDGVRREILRKELKIANDEFKAVKKNG